MLSCVITILIVFYDIFICRVSLVIITYLNPRSSSLFTNKFSTNRIVFIIYINFSMKNIIRLIIRKNTVFCFKRICRL